MLTILVTALLFTSTLGASLPSAGRIVGGDEADITDAPWQVSVLKNSGQDYYLACGGSIITHRIIATAAQCLLETTPPVWRVQGGSADCLEAGQQTDVSRFLIHPSYSSSSYRFDIALLFNEYAFFLDGITIKAISLPAQDEQVVVGSEALITGWGSARVGGSTYRNLLKAKLPIVDQQKCADSYGGLQIRDEMICAGLSRGGAGPCEGDKGGPLAINGSLIGIATWANMCGQPNYPEVFTRVASFRQWIDSNID